MYHSVKFKDVASGIVKDAWDDWGLVASSRPVISAPSAITNLVEIEGSSTGFLDLSEYTTGAPMYKPRTGDLTFIITRDEVENKGYENWVVTYTTVNRFLHNKKIWLWLEDDPYWHYVGRCTVAGFTSAKDYSQIKISYTLEPFKYHSGTGYYGSDGVWKWDPFRFGDDYILDFYTNYVESPTAFPKDHYPIKVKANDSTEIEFEWPYLSTCTPAFSNLGAGIGIGLYQKPNESGSYSLVGYGTTIAGENTTKPDTVVWQSIRSITWHQGWWKIKFTNGSNTAYTSSITYTEADV